MADKKQRRCLIICASPEADVDFLGSFVRDDDFIICADGGYAYAEQAGVRPDLIVGDFDSYDGVLPSEVETVRLNVRKDYSDAHVAATIALERGFTEVVLVFAVGGRLDHTLANICVLKYLSESGAFSYAVSAKERLYLVSDSSLNVGGCLGKTFSLFPYNSSVRVSIDGEAEYPVKDMVFTNNISLGLSNVSLSEELNVEASEGTLIMIINEKNPFNKF